MPTPLEEGTLVHDLITRLSQVERRVETLLEDRAQKHREDPGLTEARAAALLSATRILVKNLGESRSFLDSLAEVRRVLIWIEEGRQ